MLGGTDKNYEKPSIRIAGVSPEFRTEDFRNRSLKRYRYTNLLDFTDNSR
jgi:hypothetical protein